MGIVLLTDFGLADTYVGVMKGVIRRIAPTIDLIDLTHSITPQNVREAALALLTSYQYFPDDTVFLVVVDPGVGSERRPIAVQAGSYYFVAPDNGVLSYTLRALAHEAVELAERRFRLDAVSNTFHGRDIFAPAAAHLAVGVSLTALGPLITVLRTLPVPLLEIEQRQLLGEVIDVDHFGNVLTSIGELIWTGEQSLRLQPRFEELGYARDFNAEQFSVQMNGERIRGVHQRYSEVERGTLLMLVGSNGFLELAVNQGNCAARLDLHIGDRIEVRI